MAGHAPPSHRRPDMAEAQGKKGGASAATSDGGSCAWPRGPEYPNPPEVGCRRESPRYPNPPDPASPDPATLREQWLFAMRRFSRWHSRAWGAAVLAGSALFAVGWAVKGSNHVPSHHDGHGNEMRLDAAGQEP